MRELLLHPVKRRKETYGEMMMEVGVEEEGAVVAAGDLEGVVTSEAEEDFVVVSEEVLEVVVEDSVEIEAGSAVAAGQGELEADSVEVGEVSVEATTEEKAVPKTTLLHHHKFHIQKFCHFFKRIGRNFFPSIPRWLVYSIASNQCYEILCLNLRFNRVIKIL